MISALVLEGHRAHDDCGWRCCRDLVVRRSFRSTTFTVLGSMDLCVRFDPLFQESAVEDEEDTGRW